MTSPSNQVAVVILAAGQGTRMKSQRAKVLHEICGRSMLGHVFASAESLEPSRLVVVVGRDSGPIEKTFANRCDFAHQAEQRGTGHAVLQAMPLIENFEGDVLILYGDTPLLRSSTFLRMSDIKRETGAGLVMLTATGEIPGRVVRGGDGRIERIVEAQDASPEELAIDERNTGVYLVGMELLREGLASLKDHNRQGELYITDIVGHAVGQGHVVEALLLEDADECLGINTRSDLAVATAVMRRRIAERHMAAGVTLIDPGQTYIDVGVEIGEDTLIEPGVVIQGDTTIGRDVHIKAHCVIEDSRLDDEVEIGPLARLRPNCHLGRGVRIGNFVEIKNSKIGPGTKSAHLTYIGDADIGARVNLGCGTIVVNYDGKKKHRTTIEDGVFVGCNANLVSPVTLGENSFIAAGSTITRDVPEDALGLARSKQSNLEGWVARRDGREPTKSRAEKSGKEKSRAEKSGTKKSGKKEEAGSETSDEE